MRIPAAWGWREKSAASLLLLGGCACLMPWVSPPLALLGGMALALALGNPWQDKAMQAAHRLLAVSVAGMGAGMNLAAVLRAGAAGLGYTFIGILLTLGACLVLARLLRAERDTALLIGVGTAICGGSAIAAVAPVLRARQEAIALAFATVFLLNALALLVFPPLGHFFGLSQPAFGVWAALAIHDTSSVVGAAMTYGEESLSNGVVLKMARALWIMPLAFAIGVYVSRRDWARRGAAAKIKIPWFIPAFIAIAAVFTWAPGLQGMADVVQYAARRGMVLTLFLVGATVSRSALRAAGLRPLILGFVLWICVAAASLAAIRAGWIAL